jgi:endonuclease/exonuclease/phosphatase family metal-dependent hydrolase
MRFGVVTWNLRKGLGTLGMRPEFSAIGEAIQGLDPQISCCQEVLRPRRGQAQDRALALALSQHHRFTGHAANLRGVHGLATFSSFPVSRHVHEDISTNPLEQRAILHVRLHPSAGRTLHVFNVHFGLTRRQRASQAEMLAEFLRSKVRAHEPFIIAGDFNERDRALEQHLLRSLGAHNALAHEPLSARRTWPVRRPLFPLDRIYYRGLELEHARVLRGHAWHGLSDHLPIHAVFSLHDH